MVRSVRASTLFTDKPANFSGSSKLIVDAYLHVRQQVTNLADRDGTRLQAAVRADSLHPLLDNPLLGLKPKEFSEAVEQAVLTYQAPSFIRADYASKAAVIDVLAEVLDPSMIERLRQVHLPVGFADGEQNMTCSLENERGIAFISPDGSQQISRILNYYAPDPAGTLIPELIPDKFVEHCCPARFDASIWTRLSLDVKKDKLQWRDLDLVERFIYLDNLKTELDERVDMSRITNPQQVSEGQPLPDTLAPKLLWESVLRCAEVTTDSYYESLDHLYADAATLMEIDGPQHSGFHVHQVVEFKDEAEARELGPHFVGWAGLVDLALGAQGARSGLRAFTNTSLEIFKQEGLQELVDHVQEHGRFIADDVGHHKLHLGGVRSDIYGDGNRAGLETRGVMIGRLDDLLDIVPRTNRVFANKELLQKIPAPPWDGWDAGDPQVLSKAFEAYIAQPDALVGPDDVSFADLIELAGPEREGLGFQLAMPLWNWAAIPGLSESTLSKIEVAQAQFTKHLGLLCKRALDGIESDREVPSELLWNEIRAEVGSFMKRTDLDFALRDVLAELSQ